MPPREQVKKAKRGTARHPAFGHSRCLAIRSPTKKKKTRFFTGQDPNRESGQEILKKFRGSSRVGSRGAGNPTGRVGMGQEVLEIPQVESGRVKRCWKSHRSSRVGSRGAGIPQVESGRVKRCWKSRGSSRVGSRGVGNPTGRVGSGQEVLEIPRVESGQVKRCWKSHRSNRVGSGGVHI